MTTYELISDVQRAILEEVFEEARTREELLTLEGADRVTINTLTVRGWIKLTLEDRYTISKAGIDALEGRTGATEGAPAGKPATYAPGQPAPLSPAQFALLERVAEAGQNGVPGKELHGVTTGKLVTLKLIYKLHNRYYVTAVGKDRLGHAVAPAEDEDGDTFGQRSYQPVAASPEVTASVAALEATGDAFDAEKSAGLTLVVHDGDHAFDLIHIPADVDAGFAERVLRKLVAEVPIIQDLVQTEINVEVGLLRIQRSLDRLKQVEPLE